MDPPLPPITQFYEFLKSPKDKLFDLFFNIPKPSGYVNVNNEKK